MRVVPNPHFRIRHSLYFYCKLLGYLVHLYYVV